MATIARPSLQAIMSAGAASIREVGFDRGKTIGRAVAAAISRTTSSLKRPGWPETPMRIVGLARRTTSSNEMSGPAEAAALARTVLEAAR